MSSRERMPIARNRDLVTTESNGELIVYDLEAERVHYLNPVSVAVWTRCDGQSSVEDTLATLEAPAELDTVHLALAQLSDADLLDASSDVPLQAPRPTRRRLLQRSAVAAIPAIVSISAPAAASHESCGDCIPAQFCDLSNIGQCCYPVTEPNNCGHHCYQDTDDEYRCVQVP